MEKQKRKRIIETIVVVCCMMLMALFIDVKMSGDVRIGDEETPLAGTMPVTMENLLKNPENIHYLEDCDFSFKNWITGEYADKTGMYKPVTTELCLNEYKAINSKSYKVQIENDSKFIIGIAEFNSNGQFIRRNYVVNGMKYVPKSDVKYVGIYVYSYDSKDVLDYAKYETKFKNGLEIKLISEGLINQPVVQVPVVSSKPVIQEPVVENKPVEETPVVQKSNKDLFKEELMKMIVEGDTTTHTISNYGLTRDEVTGTWSSLKENECKMYLKTNNIFLIDITNKTTGIVTSVYIFGIDSDYVQRTERMISVIEKILDGVDSKMTDLDKVLYVHEYLVKNTTYNKNCEKAGCASSILGDKMGMCSGFAEAMEVVLGEMGIELYRCKSTKMNHEWNYIKLDGEVYQADTCWDNSKKTSSTGLNWHRYLLRTDEEMKTIVTVHRDFWCHEDKSIQATSTRFKDWFVHDVYGQMYYYDGLWYYYDVNTNSIVCSDVYGNNRKTVVDGTGSTVKLTNMVGNKISYKLNGVSKTLEIK